MKSNPMDLRLIVGFCTPVGVGQPNPRDGQNNVTGCAPLEALATKAVLEMKMYEENICS